MRNTFGSRLFLSLAAVFFLAGVAAPSLRSATLAADYRVQNTLNSSVGTIGPLTIVDTAADVSFVSATVLGQTQQVLNFANVGSDHGVQAQTNGFLSATTYSIVMLASFNFTLGDSVATKIFDFKNLSSDAGLYVNDLTGLLSFNGITPLPIGGTPVVTGNYTQIVLTRDGATGLTTVYQNGMIAFSFTDTNGDAVLGDATATGNAFLTVFDDDNANIVGVTNESTQGNLARLRLYDGVLTAQEVAALDTVVVPEPATWMLSAIGLGLIGLLVRRTRAA
jgi:hypothetical protein